MRGWRLGVLFLLLGACTDPEATGLQIYNVIAPNEQCGFQVPTEFYRPSENYDFSVRDGITVTPQVRNNLPSSEILTGEAGQNLRADSNDIVLQGVDMCWYRRNDVTLGQRADGVPLDCDELGAEDQRRSLAVSGSIEADGGELAMLFQALTWTDLAAQKMYGPTFNPRNVPDSDVITADVTTNGIDDPVSVVTLDSSAFTPTPPGWGNFPTAEGAYDEVIFRFRVNGRTQGGRFINSNWFDWPVFICGGCVAGACGLWEPVTCDDLSAGYAGSRWVGGCLPETGVYGGACIADSSCP